MGRIGKITSIKKVLPRANTVEATLSAMGMNRIPRAWVKKFPYKNANGTYRTGLEDKQEVRTELEGALNIKLDPRSPYYNFTADSDFKTEGWKLMDGDNVFNLDDPYAAVVYYWLTAHPSIASSYDAYERGDFGPDVEFFVNDTEIETDRQYKRDMEEAKSIVKLNSFSASKARRVARMLGFPVSDDTKHEQVYTHLYSFIKEGTAKLGPYKGLNTISKFNQFADMKDADLVINDLVEQAISHNIFRLSAGGRLMKGEAEVAKTKEDYIDFLSSKKGQDQLLQLEKDLGVKESILT